MRGERVRQLREAVPWTQPELAERARRYSDGRPIPVQTVLRIEKNQNQPSAWLLSALAQALDTTADYLLGLTDDPSIPALPRYPIPAPELYAALMKANALDVAQRVTVAQVVSLVADALARRNAHAADDVRLNQLWRLMPPEVRAHLLADLERRALPATGGALGETGS